MCGRNNGARLRFASQQQQPDALLLLILTDKRQVPNPSLLFQLLVPAALGHLRAETIANGGKHSSFAPGSVPLFNREHYPLP